MNSSTFAAIHKYGAVLSVVGIAIAVLAYVVGGPIGTTAFLFFGWAGPLGLFYFGGAYLVNTNPYASTYRTVGEELMRGVAWYFIALLAWSFIVTETTALSASPATVFALPAATALGISLVMVATRHVTGSELQVQSKGGQLLVMITGAIGFGFLTLYLVLADRAGWWLFGMYLVSLPVGFALWRVLRRRYPAAVGGN